jgi:hypothetical protein
MIYLQDKNGRLVRLTGERCGHLESDHPEMQGQITRIEETLREPERVIRSRTDPQVELYYRLYAATPVTRKYLCVVVKSLSKEDAFVVTAYFTDTPKRGDVLWATE